MGNPTALTILSIDPSVDNMGVSVFDVDVVTQVPYLRNSTTYYGRKLIKDYPDIVAMYGERNAKLYAHRQNFANLFQYWQPDIVCVEHPFMGRFPAAFGALMECMTTIRDAVINYHPRVPLYSIDPPTVKLAVGVNGKSKDKEEMRTAIRTLEGVVYNPSMELETLDEHACDSIAVGYWMYKTLYGV